MAEFSVGLCSKDNLRKLHGNFPPYKSKNDRNGEVKLSYSHVRIVR